MLVFYFLDLLVDETRLAVRSGSVSIGWFISNLFSAYPLEHSIRVLCQVLDLTHLSRVARDRTRKPQKPREAGFTLHFNKLLHSKSRHVRESIQPSASPARKRKGNRKLTNPPLLKGDFNTSAKQDMLFRKQWSCPFHHPS